MSILADLQARFVSKEGDDRRTFSYILSDQLVSESVMHVFTLAATANYQISLGGIGTHTGKKAVYLETSRRVSLGFVSGQTRNDIPANGFYFALLTNTTNLWLKPATTLATTVSVAVVKI